MDRKDNISLIQVFFGKYRIKFDENFKECSITSLKFGYK